MLKHIKRPLVVLALAFFCYLAAQGTGIGLFGHLAAILLVLLLGTYLWAWLNLGGIQVQREISTQRAQVGELARERITLINNWPIGKLWIELLDYSDLPLHNPGYVAHLPARERRRWFVRTPCTMRGKFRLGPATLSSGDPFGLFRLERQIPGSSEILVYPRTIALPGFRLPVAELPGGQSVRSRTHQVTPNVSTIRDYLPGDGMNRIHWRSTARTGQLMVKEFELDPTADVYVVLDMQERVQVQPAMQPGGAGMRRPADRQLESTEEYSVQAAASVARHLLDQGRPVGLVAWGQQREVIPAEREIRQLGKILTALAELRAYGSTSLAEVLAAEGARFGRNCTLVVITAGLDERWVSSLQHLLYRGVRAMAIIVDPESFGGWRTTAAIEVRLAELRVPTFIYRAGDDLAHVVIQRAAA
ncbi:MAG TPA: DUF58 domain-containing protein [Roseiflexaceae bacterium]|nr:DUF58 domain-containing protein [Roseiflexaceae bacterium]HMP41243.1 DUF58 domain-containing protein [Roseiflexaceae bacterium]